MGEGSTSAKDRLPELSLETAWSAAYILPLPRIMLLLFLEVSVTARKISIASVESMTGRSMVGVEIAT